MFGKLVHRCAVLNEQLYDVKLLEIYGVDYVLDSIQLRPLLSFSDLTHVELSAPAGFDLDDATIADMVRAWLHVQTLKFHASDYLHVQSNVTHAGLLSLAQYCLQLSHLELSLDASTVSQWELTPLMTDTVDFVLQLLDTALKAREYIQDFHSTPNSRQKLVSEMEDLKRLLKQLRARITANPSSRIVQQMNTQLMALKYTMEELTRDLRPGKGQIARFARQLTWNLCNKKEGGGVPC
ncbi:hypothetical protein B0H14DRAFT_3665549 [Mycena olivaceomarginata]|nr:hypothetical protein B0H14DRAFT_3665549 [Mycena olivaceomarginata]